MTKILLQRRMGALRPTDAASEAYIGKLKPDETVLVEIKRARNPHQHRLYWAAINLCFQHQDTYATQRDLHAAIKVALGYCDMVSGKHGQMAIPKSIAFGNMPQDEWEAFFERFLDLICTKIMPNTDSEELRQELDAMVAGKVAS